MFKCPNTFWSQRKSKTIYYVETKNGFSLIYLKMDSIKWINKEKRHNVTQFTDFLHSLAILFITEMLLPSNASATSIYDWMKAIQTASPRGQKWIYQGRLFLYIKYNNTKSKLTFKIEQHHCDIILCDSCLKSVWMSSIGLQIQHKITVSVHRLGHLVIEDIWINSTRSLEPL